MRYRYRVKLPPGQEQTDRNKRRAPHLRARRLTIVCEEAHRCASRDEERGFEAAKRALFRIAKEGRKYGVSLCVVTQRPSDLAPGLLSECNTIFRLPDAHG